jgi:hypothetical protein
MEQHPGMILPHARDGYWHMSLRSDWENLAV